MGRSSKPETQSIVVVEAEDFTDREQIEMDITEARGFVSSLAKKWQCSWSAARHRIKRQGLDEHLAEEKATQISRACSGELGSAARRDRNRRHLA